MKKLMFLMIAALIFIGPMATSANQEDALSRGDFFNLVVNHLELELTSENVELPADVNEGSEYENAAKILKSKGIINGYPDGTIRPDQKITNKEAGYVLGRFLNISDQDVLQVLTKEFAVAFDNNFITKENANTVIETILSSDEVALDLIEKMAIAQSEVNSYRATANLEMSMALNPEMTDEIPDMPTEMNLNGSIKMDFNDEEGLHQAITMSIPIAEDVQEMTMEQYLVPEGIFMKMQNPENGEDMWMDMSEVMPITFDQLMQMNKDNLKVNAELNNKFFFYRDLGTEEIDGKVVRKIKMDGKINSLTEMMGMFNNVMQDTSMLPQEGELPDMKVGMSGTVWVDEETALPYKQSVVMSMEHKSEQVLMPTSQKMSMEMIYSDYNEVDGITLPEAAKNAEKLPVFE